MKMCLIRLTVAPVGTIIAWSSIPNKGSKKPVQLPAGWVKCDGSVIPKGIWKGQKTPDINGEERFLRGSSKSNLLDVEDGQVQTLTYDDYTWAVECPSSRSKTGQGTPGYTPGHPWFPDQNDFHCKRTSNVGGTGGDETRPKNIRVIYIMKIF